MAIIENSSETFFSGKQNGTVRYVDEKRNNMNAIFNYFDIQIP